MVTSPSAIDALNKLYDEQRGKCEICRRILPPLVLAGLAEIGYGGAHDARQYRATREA
jgi:hypothetical protein